MQCETVKIVAKDKEQGEYVLINECDFNPATMKEYTPAAEKPVKAKKAE